MIGPPGLPKYGRRVFAFAAPKRSRSRQHQHAWKWVTGLYLAGVLAHFSHHMVGLPNGSNPSSEALTSAPLSLVWPADLMKTLPPVGRRNSSTKGGAGSIVVNFTSFLVSCRSISESFATGGRAQCKPRSWSRSASPLPWRFSRRRG